MVRCRPDQELVLDSYSGKLGKLVQQVNDEAGKLCCEASFTMGLFDLTARKLLLATPNGSGRSGCVRKTA